MKTVKLKLELITPLFMYGADGETPELRSASIKGAIRFWWRAMRFEKNWRNTYLKEGEIFGIGGDNAQKSTLQISFNTYSNNIGQNFKNDFNIQPKFDPKNRTINGKYSGIAFLLYSVLTKKYFKPEGLYNTNRQKIILIFRSDNLTSIRNAMAGFWGTVYLGGLGARSRRGAGNLRIIEASGIDDLNLPFQMIKNKENDYLNWLKENLKNAQSVVNNDLDEDKMDFVNSYTNLSFSRAIISDQIFNSWNNALSDIGKIYKEFREINRNDVFGTAVFGLPVVHRQGTIKGTQNRNTIERRSSPIIFKVVHDNGKYYWICIRMSGAFLPYNAVLKKFSRDNSYRTQRPDYSLIDDFWNELRKKGKETVLSIPPDLRKKVKMIKSRLNAKEIILFGSRARGDFRSNSDVDIALNTDNPIDILDLPGVFDIVNIKKIKADFYEKIKKEGVAICEKD